MKHLTSLSTTHWHASWRHLSNTTVRSVAKRSRASQLPSCLRGRRSLSRLSSWCGRVGERCQVGVTPGWSADHGEAETRAGQHVIGGRGSEASRVGGERRGRREEGGS
eukprot:3932129-Rhodomonas_salina.1